MANTSTEHNVQTEVLQLINEVDILRNNFVDKLKESIDKLRVVINEQNQETQPNTQSWSSLGYPFSQQLQGEVKNSIQPLLPFEDTRQAMEFITKTVEQHTGTLPSRFIDVLGGFGSYSMATFCQLHRMASRRGDVLLFEKSREIRTQVGHNLSLYRRRYDQDSVSVREDFLDWFEGEESDVYDNVVLLDATKFSDLFQRETTMDRVEFLVDDLLKCRPSCVVLKTAASYCEKKLTVSTSESDRFEKSQRRVYSMLFESRELGLFKYMIIFPERVDLAENKGKRGYISHHKKNKKIKN